MRYGAINRNKPGNQVSGDAFLFHENGNHTLVALIDGLGAGEAAQEAAEKARRCVLENPSVPLTDLLKLCHKALRGTRGAVMMLMRVSRKEEAVAFAGIGNIGVRVFSNATVKPISRNGIVGYRMNNVREFSYPYKQGDVFILHSDGISTRFTVDEAWVRDPRTDLQQVAEDIAREFGKDDDMTIIVVR